MSKLPTAQEFTAYLTVQYTGHLNMYSMQARKLSGLTEEKYVEVMKNYDLLKDTYHNEYRTITAKYA